MFLCLASSCGGRGVAFAVSSWALGLGWLGRGAAGLGEAAEGLQFLLGFGFTRERGFRLGSSSGVTTGDEFSSRPDRLTESKSIARIPNLRLRLHHEPHPFNHIHKCFNTTELQDPSTHSILLRVPTTSPYFSILTISHPFSLFNNTHAGVANTIVANTIVPATSPGAKHNCTTVASLSGAVIVERPLMGSTRKGTGAYRVP